MLEESKGQAQRTGHEGDGLCPCPPHPTCLGVTTLSSHLLIWPFHPFSSLWYRPAQTLCLLQCFLRTEASPGQRCPQPVHCACSSLPLESHTHTHAHAHTRSPGLLWPMLMLFVVYWSRFWNLRQQGNFSALFWRGSDTEMSWSEKGVCGLWLFHPASSSALSFLEFTEFHSGGIKQPPPHPDSCPWSPWGGRAVSTGRILLFLQDWWRNKHWRNWEALTSTKEEGSLMETKGQLYSG